MSWRPRLRRPAAAKIALKGVGVGSSDIMEQQLRDGVYLLQRKWKGRVELEPVTSLDHYYSDGAACGSCFKLVFYDSLGYVSTAFLFPNGCWSCTNNAMRLEHTMATWLTEVKALFDPVVAKAAANAKAEAIQEELVAAAFKPARVAAALEAGANVEDL
jgi:hypothetical protein